MSQICFSGHCCEITMEFTARLLLLLTLKWLICSPFCAEYYVKPTLDTKCSEQCYTLSHYISNSQHYFVSNVTFRFLPGIFILESNQPLSIRNIASVSLIGSERYTIANLNVQGQVQVVDWIVTACSCSPLSGYCCQCTWRSISQSSLRYSNRQLSSCIRMDISGNL